jgi:hypothetical protein
VKKFSAFALMFLVAGIPGLQPAGAAGGWELAKNSSGIKVYERSVPGTDLMEYMGVVTIDAKMEVIGEVLRDVKNMNKWLADCYGAQVEKQISRNDMVIFMVLRPPIIQERDIVLKDKTVYDYENGKASITFQATDEVKIPLEEKRVRVTNMTGLFDMEYLGRNKTRFIYRLMVDPGGSIPKKVAYAVMKSYPYNSLKGLRSLVTDSTYADRAKGTDEEKQINARANSEAAVRKILTNRLLKYVNDRASLGAIIAADRDAIRAIAASGGSYVEVEKATIGFYFKYIEKLVPDRAEFEKLKKNRDLIAEMTDVVVTDCGATGLTVDAVLERYRRK